MKRATRCLSSSGSSSLNTFQDCIGATDAYARKLNLKLLILDLPLDEDVHSRDLYGLTIRLTRNKSFLYTSCNPNPPSYPCDVEPFLQKVDLSNGDSQVDALVATLGTGPTGDARRGIIVMFVQPPVAPYEDVSKLGQGCKPQHITSSHQNDLDFDDLTESRPLVGILFKIGSSNDINEARCEFQKFDVNTVLPNGLSPSVSDTLERSMVGAFCRRSVPDDVSEEIFQVILLRGIVEAICYEDFIVPQTTAPKRLKNLSHSSNGVISVSYDSEGRRSHARHSVSNNINTMSERDKRFISINTHDLVLCPYFLLPVLLEKLRFVKHWDREDGMNEFVHEDTVRECSCIKKVKNMTLSSKLKTVSGKHPETQSFNNDPDEFYQFFTLSAKRLKLQIEKQLRDLVPESPCENAIKFCHGYI